MTTAQHLTRWLALSLALGTALGARVGAATAQPVYPSKPIRLVIPMPPGGGTDA